MAIVIALSSTSAYAGFNWENNITVETYGMTWGYTEQYTEENFVFYKSYIDADLGNDDDYISAWELLKVDSITRKSFHDSIINKMDVKINDSSSDIHLSEIESSISEDALGKVYERGNATNYYKVRYSFDEALTELGTNIWLLAESGTNVTIIFPAGIDVTSTQSIENTTMIMNNNITTISGIVGFGGQISIGYTENKTWKKYMAEPPGDDTETSTKATEVDSHVPYNPVDRIIEWLGLEPKR